MLKKMKGKVGSAVFLSTFAVGSAHAALPAEVGTGITELQTDGLAMQALIWPAVIAVVIGWRLFSMFKKGANKV